MPSTRISGRKRKHRPSNLCASVSRRRSREMKRINEKLSESFRSNGKNDRRNDKLVLINPSIIRLFVLVKKLIDVMRSPLSSFLASRRSFHASSLRRNVLDMMSDNHTLIHNDQNFVLLRALHFVTLIQRWTEWRFQLRNRRHR